MAERLPLHELETDYAKHFKSCGRGEVASNVRMAMDALLIKEFRDLSDRAVVDTFSVSNDFKRNCLSALP